VSIAAGDEEF
jgi:hypothetical protein